MIDWQASKDEWVDSVRALLIARLRLDARLVGAGKMESRFNISVEAWRKDGNFRPVINNGNELAAAASILDRMAADDRLLYEPRLSGTPKSIDFCIQHPNRTRTGIDMKTIAPGRQDDDAAWKRFLEIAKGFPEQAPLMVDRRFASAAIGMQLLKTRWTFIQRAAEVEAKAALLHDAEKGPVRLLLCSEGAWHEDDLEDFADFYRTGAFREDDWARNAIIRYMRDQSVGMDRSLACFCFLERRHEEVLARRFTST
jgi:hypothetical protein